MAIRANEAITGGIPTWRYLYNATFPNLQPYPGALVYHGSESMTFSFLSKPTTPILFYFSSFRKRIH